MVKSFEQEKIEYKEKQSKKRIKYAFSIAIISLLLALAAFSESEINNVFLIVENNTDIGYPGGTGERLYNTTYYANSSPIAIMLKAHAVGVNKDMDFNLSINGTVVQDVDHRTAVGAGIHEHESIYAIIPRGSNYSVRNSTDIIQMEWREYPILSGKNGTLSVNQTNIYQNTSSGGGGISFNGSAVDMNGSSFYNGSQQAGTFNHSNLTKLNWKEANHTIDDVLNMQGYNISNINYSHANDFVSLNGKEFGISFSPDWHFYTQSEGNTNAMVMLTASSNFSFSTNFFGGVRSRGNFSNPQPCQNGDALFYFYGISYDGTQWQSGRTNPNIVFRCAGTWTATSNPTKITMSNTVAGSTSQVQRFDLNGSRLNLVVNDIKLDGMQQSDPSGSTNMYVCWDSGTNQTFLNSGACV